MPIRIAAIEVGHWHSLFDAAYLKAVVRMPDLELVGIQDPDAALAAQRAAELGNPPVHADYREMLARTRPDFVIALGRHNAMAGIAHHLLDEGYPFLIEKPVGLDAREVGGVAEKVARKRGFAAVPLFQRLHPFATHARRLIAAGAFGPLSHFHFRSNRGSSARYVSWGASWMLDPAIAGGGCLRNIGTHGVDLFLYMLGEPAAVTGAAVSARALGREVEDFAAVTLRSSSGVLGIVEVGNTYPAQGADGEWKLSGRDGLLLQADGNVRWITTSGEAQLSGPPAEPLPIAALRDALARWQAGQPPAVGVEDCLQTTRLIDRAYEIAAA